MAGSNGTRRLSWTRRPTGSSSSRRRWRRLTACSAFNGLVARGAMDAARQMGIAVPAQLSVVGYDDVEFAARLDPPLTTVRYSAREISARAIECLVQVIQDSLYPP